METSPTEPPTFSPRIACLWFPNWPIQRLVVARPELRWQYLVLFQQDPRRGRLVAATSPLAMQAGVRVGMPLSEAKSLLQRAAASNRGGRAQPLRFVTNSNHRTARAVPLENPDPFFIFEHDPAADHLALTELADSLSQFSPIVGLEQIDSPADKNFASSILLEITGLERLFGSEEQLAAELFQFVQDLGYLPRLAIANTLGVVWGASRFGMSRSISRKVLGQMDAEYCLIIHPDDHETFLQLPIESLRLAPHIIDLLHQLGIETNEQVWRLPRAELAMRFGDAIHRRIDQATGKLPEPVVARQTPTEFAATQLLEYPTNHRETIEVIIGRLVEQIGQQLRARQQGGLQWLITLLLVDEPAIGMNLNLFQATATASEVMPLVEMQLEQQLLPKHPKKSLLPHSTPLSILKRDGASRPGRAAGDELAIARIGEQKILNGVAPHLVTEKSGVNGREQPQENKPSSRCRIQVQEIRVAVTSAVLLVPQQRLLFDEGPQLNRQALTQLINRLTSRLGQQQVVYPQLLSGAQPEYSYRFRSLVDIHRRRRSSGKFAAQSHVVGRPLRIFNPAIEIELEMKNPRDRSSTILCDTTNPSPPTPFPQGGEGSLSIGLDYGSGQQPCSGQQSSSGQQPRSGQHSSSGQQPRSGQQSSSRQQPCSGQPSSSEQQSRSGQQPYSGQYQASVPLSNSESNSQSAPNLPSPPWGRGVGGEGERLIHSLFKSKDGATFTITQAIGPERIETGWWRGPTVGRDYWRVETDTGQSLWIYRDLRQKSWFLQGEF